MLICTECGNYPKTTAGLNYNGVCENCCYKKMINNPYDIDYPYDITCESCKDYRGLINNLFNSIAHGDDEHRTWLKKAIEDHFEGREVEKAKGKGTRQKIKDLLTQALELIERG